MKLRRPWTEEDDQALAEAISGSLSMRRLCSRLKRHETTIRTQDKVRGLTIKPAARLTRSERQIRSGSVIAAAAK